MKYAEQYFMIIMIWTFLQMCNFSRSRDVVSWFQDAAVLPAHSYEKNVFSF